MKPKIAAIALCVSKFSIKLSIFFTFKNFLSKNGIIIDKNKNAKKILKKVNESIGRELPISFTNIPVVDRHIAANIIYM